MFEGIEKEYILCSISKEKLGYSKLSALSYCLIGSGACSYMSLIYHTNHWSRVLNKFETPFMKSISTNNPTLDTPTEHSL